MIPVLPIRFPTIAALALGLSMLSGCGSNNLGQIEGTSWISKAGTVGDDEIKQGDLILEFGEDGTMRARTFGTYVRGKYTLGAGDRVSMEFDDRVLGEKEHRLRISIEEETLTFRDSSGSLEFTRVKPQEEPE